MCLIKSESLEEVPGDGLSLSVLIGREPYCGSACRRGKIPGGGTAGLCHSSADSAAGNLPSAFLVVGGSYGCGHRSHRAGSGMKTVFLKRENTPALRIFFNGWSRDAHCFDGWTSDCDVLEVHDYTELDTAVFSELLKPYSELHLAAWSLGVWAAAKVFEKVSVRLDSALALNGTLVPVHADYGIAPEIFDGTIIHCFPPFPWQVGSAGPAERCTKAPWPPTASDTY